MGSRDVANGGTGDDTIVASGGPRVLDGSAGHDTLRLDSDISHTQILGFERLETAIRHSLSRLAASQFDSFSEIGAGPGRKTAHFWITGGGSSVLRFDPALERVSIEGGNAYESLTLAAGTRTALLYNGRRGDSLIVGGDIGDVLSGGAGADTLRGGAGDDVIYATGSGATDSDPDWLFGASGDDSLYAAENDSAFGGTGDDSLFAEYAAGSLHGDSGDDVLFASSGGDTLDGGAGNDTVSYARVPGSGGHVGGHVIDLALTTQQATGGSGFDLLMGLENVIGSNADDTLSGTDGDNIIEGGRGNDSLTGGGGRDTASYGGAGADVAVDLRIIGGQDTGGAEVDTLDGFSNLIGGAGNDALTGGVGRNIIEGGAGNDIIDGRIGVDLADYSHAATTVQVNLALTTAQNTRGAGTDTLISMEDVRGSAFADGLAGSAAQNRIDGGAGDDTLVGAANNDTLTGGLGADRLRGGTGFDTFDFNATSESTARAPDLILDFIGAGASWGDLIDLADIDADTTVAGNQAFSLGLRGAGGLTLVNVGSDTLVRGNTDADAAFEIAILLRDGGRPASAYAEHDFLL